MKIETFNTGGIKARLPALLDALAAIGPDEDDERVLLAQLLDSLRLYRRSQRAKIGEVILVDL